MRIRLDQSSPMPIYAQVMEEVRWAVSSGEIEPGEQLPTVRQLAVELRINPNTVARAYSELERLGLIATQQGRGTFVIASKTTTADIERQSVLRRLARAVAAEANALGFTPAELVRAISEVTGQEDIEDADHNK